MAARPGFIVKNAVAVGANLDIAEPDAIDYNLLANGRFGVISGCDVTASGSSWTLNVAAGIYVVNDSLVTGGGQVLLPTASQDARFDLIVGDAAGHVSAIQGTPSSNPVFPDKDLERNDVTVFAAVMVRPGILPPQQVDITDKRVILPTRFTTALTAGSLLHNADPVNALAPLFDIDWNGKHQWDGDAFLERSGTQTLRVTTNLDVVGTLSSQDLTLDGNLTAAGDVTADNLKAGNGNPAVVGHPGDLYRDLATGAVWAYENGSWQQLATTPIPVGFTMMGFVTTPPPGWLLVDGSRVTRAASGGLWNALPAWRTTVSGVDYVQLPDAKDCFFAWGQPGVKGGNASGSVNISTANLPAHRHLTSPSGQMNPGGSHSHPVDFMSVEGAHTHITVPRQGNHGHDLVDSGHVHGAIEGGSGFVAAAWGAPNKLDGLFNDASHTWNVDVTPWTFPAKTGIWVDGTSGSHVHTTDLQGGHAHGLTIGSNNTAHTHVINEVDVGLSQPLNISPPFMGQYLYVKT